MVEWMDWGKIVLMLERGCTGAEVKEYSKWTKCRVHQTSNIRTKTYCECPLSGDCHGGFWKEVEAYKNGAEGSSRESALAAARIILEILESSAPGYNTNE